MSIRRLRPEDGYDASVGRIAQGVDVGPGRVILVCYRLGLWPYGRRYARPLLPNFEGLPFSLGLGLSDRRFLASFLDVLRRRPVR